ncbi:hypothetical protein [Novosphingobium sp.]|uniref:hypothetical protein n=1 Tax=Novosphingobium sp. TaxID=1874826 RepID=UPI0025F0F003|nr:hypothetical protein [Novosphingobium sp.]
MTFEIPTCFVALFDIVGFKAMRQKLGTAGLMQKFERSALPMIQYSAAGKFKHEIRGERQFSVPDFDVSSLGYRVFSDTVIYWTQDDTLLSFLKIVFASSQLIASGFGSNAPYRGAIGHGDFLLRGEIILGEALEDAYLWEASQAWAGVSLTPKCEEFCRQQDYLEQRNRLLSQASEDQADERLRTKILQETHRLVSYEIPLQSNPKDGAAKYSAKDGIVLDWTLNVYEGAATKSLVNPSNSHAQHIREQTIAFEEWARRAAKDRTFGL